MNLGISYLAIGPEIVLVLGAVAVLMLEVSRRPSRRTLGSIAAVSLIAAAVITWFQWRRALDDPFSAYRGMVVVDPAAVLGRMALLLAASLGLVAAWPMMDELRRRGAEGIALVLLSTVGFTLMGASNNLVMIFLGLEVASISLYILAGINRDEPRSDEAALKYFLLGSFASAIFAYGIALTFAASGAIDLVFVRGFFSTTVVTRPAVLYLALGMLIVGLAFKVSAAPFHAWAPDVYQGAPAGIVGYMATAAKIGAFIVLIRVLALGFEDLQADWAPAIAALAILSVVVGTVGAVGQADVRRLLAYSGVAHAGFMLTALVAGFGGAPAVMFYLFAYVVQLMLAFAVVRVVTGPMAAGAPIERFRGLGERAPFLAAVMAVAVFALSGIPLTSGFIAKFGVFAAAWQGGYGWLVIAGVVASVAAFYFYLRVVVAMYFHAPADAPGTATATPQAGPGLRIALWLGVIATIAFGIYPTPLLDLVSHVVTGG